MKRLGRWLFNGVASLSMLICLATAVVWVRSYWVADSLLWMDGDYEPVIYEDWRTFDCNCGGVRVSHEHYEWHGAFSGAIFKGHSFSHGRSQATNYPYYTISFQWAPPTTDLRLKGFEFVYLHDEYNRVQSVTIPLAAIFFPALFLPALRTRQGIKRRCQSKGNFCTSCGYDLRATPDRCPECGTVPTKK
jgi:hypothetical protein